MVESLSQSHEQDHEQSYELSLREQRNKCAVGKVAYLMEDLRMDYEEARNANLKVEGDNMTNDSSLEEMRNTPEQMSIEWASSNPDGTVAESQYSQQSRSVISNIGRKMDAIKIKITTDEQAAEWLKMKESIAVAMGENNPYKLADIRTEMLPVWDEYLQRMSSLPEVDSASQDDYALAA